MSEWFNHAVALAHFFLRESVGQGDIVIDATAGNGRDTLFLAELVGEKGRVMAIDIQKIALERTRALLEQKGLNERVELFCADHAEIKQLIAAPIKAVVFNLGYLPGGDHNLVTIPEKTVAALQQSLELLLPGGLVVLLVYTGHDGGMEEAAAINDFVRKLPQKEWDVLNCNYPNQFGNPPYLLLIRQRAGGANS